MRTCQNCGGPVKGRIARYCNARPCRRAWETGWKAANPERTREYARRNNAARVERLRADPELRARRNAQHMASYHRRRDRGASKHHIAPAEVFAKLYAEQDGRCAICRMPETTSDPSGRIKRLAVDHDRGTGAVRGLLCARCNTALGLLQHDPRRTQMATDYLERHGAVASIHPDTQRSAIGVLDRAVKETG